MVKASAKFLYTSQLNLLFVSCFFYLVWYYSHPLVSKGDWFQDPPQIDQFISATTSSQLHHCRSSNVMYDIYIHIYVI